MYDGTLADFKKKYAGFKIIEISYENNPAKLKKMLQNKKLEFTEKENLISIIVPVNTKMHTFLKDIISSIELTDLKIEDPLLELVVKSVYEMNLEKAKKKEIK